MKIAILGNGIEGQSIEKFFTSQETVTDINIYDNFVPSELPANELSSFDLVFRSPSVSPHQLPAINNLTTATKYFFAHCPATIIGVTGTKGKGTTSSLIATILKTFGLKVHLVGNIGTSAITALPKIKARDVVVYEMSSFQLWDLDQSPHIAVVLRIAPDHLNIHDDFADYVNAKSNITRYQKATDYCIYYHSDPDSAKIASYSPGTKIPYPDESPKLLNLIRNHINIPGEHNVENATAAISAVASFFDQNLESFLNSHKNYATVKAALQQFQGLPHRIQFIRELNGVKYYNDNYSTTLASLDVALNAFQTEPIVLIAGGISKEADEATISKRIFSTPNLKKAILIGDTKEALAEKQNPLSYIFAETLPSAVEVAHDVAESYADDGETVIVLMSPAHASFDMFKNASDRGEQFIKLIKKLK